MIGTRLWEASNKMQCVCSELRTALGFSSSTVGPQVGWIARGQPRLLWPVGTTIFDMKDKLPAKRERAQLISRSSLLPMVFGGWARAQDGHQVECPPAAIQSSDLNLPVAPGLSG